MNNITIKFLLTFILFYSHAAFSEIYPITLPPNTDVASVVATDNKSGSAKIGTSNYDDTLPFAAISTNRRSCIPDDEFYIKDGKYYFYLLNENNDHVGYAMINYDVGADWYTQIGIAGGVFTYLNGNISSSMLSMVDTNPYCINIYANSSETYFDAGSSRKIDWTILGASIEFFSTDLVQPGLYYLGLRNGTRIDTLYYISRSSSANPLASFSIPAKSIAFEIITEDACNLSISGNNSLKYHVSTSTEQGLFASEPMLITMECENVTGNWLTLSASARIRKGFMIEKNQLIPEAITEPEYIDSIMYIEGFIADVDESLDPAEACIGNGDIEFTGEKIIYGGHPFSYDGNIAKSSLGLIWNLCIDSDDLNPGVYSAAVDLSIFVE